MPKAKPVQLAHRSFAKQGDALEYYKSLLAKSAVGVTLKGRDFRDVEALLGNHPRAAEKIGVGIKRLYVGHDENGGKCFHVERTDGTGDNFSYKKCIAGDPSPFTRFCIGCRRAVEDELHQFKSDYFADNGNDEQKVKCPETGKWVDFEGAHVDHRSPMSFSVIVKTFVDAFDVDLEKVEYDRDGLYGNELADCDLAHRFAKYHRKTATLRVIAAERNLEKAPLARVKMTRHDRKL